MVEYAGSPTRTVYVDVTFTQSNVMGLLNFRQLAKPCMLAAMSAAPFLVLVYIQLLKLFLFGQNSNIYNKLSSL